MSGEDRDDAGLRELLRAVVLELRALRRLVGLAFVVGVLLLVGVPLVVRLGS